ncbi:hypothetical protein HMPREF1631_00305 [Arcanobacterium sp. S3PF19]|nr:hypothetical protein HMPREF1631_00305 [Arcanobacterium sp. S3PF19]
MLRWEDGILRMEIAIPQANQDRMNRHCLIIIIIFHATEYLRQVYLLPEVKCRLILQRDGMSSARF